MSQSYLKKMAHTMIHYSMKLEKGEWFVIRCHPSAKALAKEVYKEALAVGAHPQVWFQDQEFDELFYKNASEEQLTYIDPISKLRVEKLDAMLYIQGSDNTKALANVPSEKMVKSIQAKKELNNLYFERADSGALKWCICQYPTNSAAQDAEMSLDEYEDFVFGACLLKEEDPIQAWKDLHDHQEKIISYLADKKELRFKSTDTDLTLSVDGRKWINSDGRNNFPSGEVFTSPVEDSANGVIRFTFPGVFMDKPIEDITLTFENGKVIDAKAKAGNELLQEVLNTDEGARFLGECAIGTNYGIQNFTKNILFDEKLGGTIHLAVGRGFGEAGGTNVSSIHWDLICDMKTGGEIYADGELFYQNGKFIK